MGGEKKKNMNIASFQKGTEITNKSAGSIWLHINQNYMQMHFRSALAQFRSNPDVSLAQATYIPRRFGLAEPELLLSLV